MARSARVDRRLGAMDRRGVVPRVTSAGKLNFPLQMVVAITVASVGIAGAQWASTYGLRSDIRNIDTRIEMGHKLVESESKRAQERADAQSKLQDERMTAIRDMVTKINAELRLQQIEVQGLKEQVSKLQGGMR